MVNILASVESDPRYARAAAIIHAHDQHQETHPMTSSTPPGSCPPMTSLPPARDAHRPAAPRDGEQPITTLAHALRHNLDVVTRAAAYGQDLIRGLEDDAVANLLEAAVAARKRGVSFQVLDAAAAGIRHAAEASPLHPAGPRERPADPDGIVSVSGAWTAPGPGAGQEPGAASGFAAPPQAPDGAGPQGVPGGDQ